MISGDLNIYDALLRSAHALPHLLLLYTSDEVVTCFPAEYAHKGFVSFHFRTASLAMSGGLVSNKMIFHML